MEKDITQAELARATGMNEMTVVNWEKAERMPRRYAMVKRLCERLRLDYGNIAARFGLEPLDNAVGFGAALREARIKMGSTQEEAARLAGIDLGTLARWEKSDHEPPVWMGRKLSEVRRVLGTPRSVRRRGESASTLNSLNASVGNFLPCPSEE